MTAFALTIIAAAMLLIRVGWTGRRGAAIAGWSLATIVLVVLASEAGAWGVALGCLVSMGVAIGALLQAGWVAPIKMRRAPRDAPSISLTREPAELARRLAVFVLVVPVAFVAAQWLAFGAQALARRLGTGEADATVLALFLQPLLWAVLMTWQMTRADVRRMLVPPASAAVLATVFWSVS